MSTTELFRPQALRARGSRLHDGLVLPRLRYLSWLALVAPVLGCALVAFLALTPYRARETAQGLLQSNPGLISIVAVSDATVRSVAVVEGEHAAANSALLELYSSATTATGTPLATALLGTVDSRVHALNAARDAELGALDARLASLQRQRTVAGQELASLTQDLAQAQALRALAQQAHDAAEALKARGHVDPTLVRKLATEDIERSIALSTLQRDRLRQERELLDLEQQMAQVAVSRESLKQKHQLEIAQITQQRIDLEFRGGSVLTAPAPGLVAARLVEPGQTVKAGQVLLTLIPDGAVIEAQVLASSRAAARTAPGTRVQLRVPAFPWQQHGHLQGTVLRVGSSALTPGDLGPAWQSLGITGPRFRMVVRLDARPGTQNALTLLPGMAVEADLPLESRSLFGWLLQPLSRLGERLTG